MKRKILTSCLQQVSDKLKSLKSAIADLQESAGEDSKSSVGDKYETSRAMIHLEQENLMTQYNEMIKVHGLLSQIRSDTVLDVGMVGALIETNNGNFYISVGLGKIDLDGYSVFAIAPNSPIGSAFLGKKVGEKIELNGRDYTITKIQ
ncbi:MAG TPA: 3-oxoacyl-ACP synthase [Fulvivirga sp.]|nr:3-oxoacyl-ACP synthase [Fulvivirga sp.]